MLDLQVLRQVILSVFPSDIEAAAIENGLDYPTACFYALAYRQGFERFLIDYCADGEGSLILSTAITNALKGKP
jgi:hypothetical protein